METWIVITGLGARLVLGILFGLSIWSIAIIVDRAKVFRSVVSSQNIKNIKSWIKASNWKALADYAAKNSSISARIVTQIREGQFSNSSEIDRMAKSCLSEERIQLEHGLTVLATLGSNAPFIGLFGTVLGIIQAFGVLGQKQSGGASVMTGISEALIATAVGLFVAIPAVTAYNYFSRKLKIIILECDAVKDYYVSHLGK